MDPNFIHLDWERTLDALMLVGLFSIIVERALSVLFQSRVYIEHLHKEGMKETIALAVSIAVCATWKLDAIGMILLTETTTVPGYILTGALVAGGAKGSVKLFEDWLNLQSSAFRMRRVLQAEQAAAAAEKSAAEAQAAPTKAAAEIARAKVQTHVRRAQEAAVAAAAEGKAVPSSTLHAAEHALAEAEAAVAAKREL